MSELEFEERMDRQREALHMANVDANNFRDALKDIFALCLENRRGIVGEIESIARRALEAAL